MVGLYHPLTNFSTGIFTISPFFEPGFKLAASVGFDGLFKSVPHTLSAAVFVRHDKNLKGTPPCAYRTSKTMLLSTGDYLILTPRSLYIVL